jgi:hypothetical protein
LHDLHFDHTVITFLWWQQIREEAREAFHSPQKVLAFNHRAALGFWYGAGCVQLAKAYR